MLPHASVSLSHIHSGEQKERYRIRTIDSSIYVCVGRGNAGYQGGKGRCRIRTIDSTDHRFTPSMRRAVEKERRWMIQTLGQAKEDTG